MLHCLVTKITMNVTNLKVEQLGIGIHGNETNIKHIVNLLYQSKYICDPKWFTPKESDEDVKSY
jgi:hypothetical protein